MTNTETQTERDERLAAVLAKATELADAVVVADRHDRDPEAAHGDQDALAYIALEAIAENSSDEWTRRVAAQALRAFQTEGTRWFA